MTRAQIIQSLTPQETILNVLIAERYALTRKINWLIGEEREEIDARIDSIDRALNFVYQMEA